MFAKQDNYAVCVEDYGSIKKYARVPESNELYAEVKEWLRTNEFVAMPDSFEPPKSDEQKLAQAKQDYDDAIKTLIGEVPYTEIASWDKQESEARALLANEAAVTPFLDALVVSRGLNETRLELAGKVVANADAYIVGSAQALGIYQKRIKEIEGMV